MNHKEKEAQTTTEDKDKNANLKKGSRSEFVWKVTLLFITIASSFLGQKLYQFQTIPEFQSIRKGFVSELFGYGLLFALVFGIIDYKIHSTFDPLCYKYYLNLSKYPVQKTRWERCYTLVKWGYSLFYYALSSISAYMILRSTSTLPPWLGGNGDTINFYWDVPKFDGDTIEMRIFYICQFGKHFSRFFSHCFIRPEGSFFEYALHHGLSCFLIVFSYLTNLWLVGIMVLLLHDITDLTLILGRGYRDYKYLNKHVLNYFYVQGFLNWFFWRVFVFSYCCIYPAIYYGIFFAYDRSSQIDIQVFVPIGWFMVFMMGALEVMQLFWTYYLVKSFLSVTVTSKVKHDYDEAAAASNDISASKLAEDKTVE